jgi:L-threonylcarbamoyladenylate synthase
VPPTRDIDRAVTALRRGNLVAFPTETVYGLGADAESSAAVGRVFTVKGRPQNHPLIVHVASADELSRWAETVPPGARALAEACWPGPLTILLRKSGRVPDATTGGSPNVGLRVPAHPVALELLQKFGGGIAAPSANRFGRVSPTKAEHVRADLGDDVEVVLDGGECQVGVESTIVDLTGNVPTLLRPGGVTREQLEALLGVALSTTPASGARAPGLLPSHYAPRARVEVVATERLAPRAAELAAAGERVALLASYDDTAAALGSVKAAIFLDLGVDAASAAQRLYSALREADSRGATIILASPPKAVGLGAALLDRLSKAAGPRD